MTPDPEAGTPLPPMSHREFLDAYGSGGIVVNFDPQAAARFLSVRLLLPLFMLPLLGIGVGLALSGWIWTGLLVIALGIVAPRLIKRGAPSFLMQQMLGDEKLYRDAVQAGIFHVVSRPGA